MLSPRTSSSHPQTSPTWSISVSPKMVGETRLTTVGAKIGSWAYMAPERFTDQEITPFVDVYALTCVLYESLTGKLPFPTDSQDAVVAAHLTSPPPLPKEGPPKVPAALDDVIARGMAKEPDDRYGSTGALGRAANRALRGSGITSADPMDHMPTQPASWPPMPVNHGWLHKASPRLHMCPLVLSCGQATEPAG